MRKIFLLKNVIGIYSRKVNFGRLYTYMSLFSECSTTNMDFHGNNFLQYIRIIQGMPSEFRICWFQLSLLLCSFARIILGVLSVAFQGEEGDQGEPGEVGAQGPPVKYFKKYI